MSSARLFEPIVICRLATIDIPHRRDTKNGSPRTRIVAQEG